MIDDFDLGQVDDCGDGYFNDWFDTDVLSDDGFPLDRLTPEDYADIFLENFN